MFKTGQKRYLVFSQIIGITLLTMTIVSLTGCIHDAARKGDLGAIRLYASLGGDLDAKERFNFKWSVDTPLILAARNNQYEAVKLLIELGADIDEQGEAWYTPIFCAARNGDEDMVVMLLNSGAKIEPFGSHNSALNSAVHGGHIKVAEILLAHGANINRKGIDGATPLHNAVTNGHVDMVKFLIQNGADVNSRASYGCTPLYLAYQGKNVEMAKILLQHGADPQLKCHDWKIPKSFIEELRE